MNLNDFIPSGKRKKLNEIKGHFHCSIVGTCLSLKELEKIQRKANVLIPKNSTEHEIHGIFVYLAGEDELPAKLMTKLLDKKFEKEVREFSKLKTDSELKQKWKHEYENGNIPGPYWALMSHPFSSAKTLADAFGEVHMLSHMIGRSTRADIKRVKRVEEENDRLNVKIRTLKRAYSEKFADLNKKYEQEKTKTNQLFSYLDDTEKELNELKNKNNSAAAQNDNSLQSQKIFELESSVDFLKNENAILCKKIKDLEKELESKKYINSFFEPLNNPPQEIKCSGCTSNNCPGPDLCGKKILYVGGRKNILPRYKEIVEEYGGEFIYHDGGMESSKKSIDNAVSSADMVFCPVDCTSHDACLRLKKICKKTEKSFIPLKSSGASSFGRYIKNI
ncbi:MAG: DUF2325 domain-containing protein [Desulfobacteraceae bacterium]|nr:DUF2325 domain-containing protein [Desulfobacteraceae bacterium]